MRVIFVKRGAFSTFSVLSDSCQSLQDVDVRWDRRCGEDRRSKEHPINGERRRDNRRRSSTPASELQGYTVVEFSSASE